MQYLFCTRIFVPEKGWNSGYNHGLFCLRQTRSGTLAIFMDSCVCARQGVEVIGPAPPVRLVRFQPDHFFSPSALTTGIGDNDVCGSIDERSTGNTELAAQVPNLVPKLRESLGMRPYFNLVLCHRCDRAKRPGRGRAGARSLCTCTYEAALK